TQIRREILDRILARRGRVHWFDTLDPAKTAALIIDMQETFCAPGGPAEVPSARAIVASINTLTAGLRVRGVPVAWVLHANTRRGGATDWDMFFNYVVADDVRERTIESLAPGRQRVWGSLVTTPQDLTIIKNRYSALIAGSSGLEHELRGRRAPSPRSTRWSWCARFQGGHGFRLLRGAVGPGASGKPGNDYPAVR